MTEQEETEAQEPKTPFKMPSLNPQIAKQMQKAMELVGVLSELLPPMEIKPMTYKGKEVIAIIIDRPKGQKTA